MNLIMKRFPSVFVANKKAGDKATPPADGPLTDTEFVGLSLKNVEIPTNTSESPCTFYEQYCIDDAYFRIGVCV